MLATGLALSAMPAAAQKSEQVCPVAIESLDLGYGHQGGQSKPQLTAMLGNRTEKRVARARFRLSVLDPSGYANPYPQDLTFDQGLDVHMRRRHIWSLEPESVNIHRTGQSLVLLSVEFDDRTAWKDDGSESCVVTVDYHAR
jgi:hypothetical protein